MLTHGRLVALALALDEGKTEAHKARGQTHRSMWVHEILWARKHLREYHRLVKELKLDGVKGYG